MAIVGILLIALIMLMIMMAMGVVILVALKMSGYQPKDMDDWLEEDDE